MEAKLRDTVSGPFSRNLKKGIAETKSTARFARYVTISGEFAHNLMGCFQPFLAGADPNVALLV